ncbi:MAG: beta-mannosidase [Saprospiraceae bacterium]
MHKFLFLFFALFAAMPADAVSPVEPENPHFAPDPYLPKTFVLPETWQFRQADSSKQWAAVKAPVSVHTALQQTGAIDDPFYRDNEAKLQWIEQADWEFQTTFDVPEEVLKKAHVDLVLRGLDTYAHVYINDSLVVEADNQFRTWRADVKKWLQPTGNRIHIYFESPLKKTDEEWKNLGYELPGGQRTMTRKAQFHYGWDWGPRFVGAGLLKLPELVGWTDVLIENVWVTHQEISPERARMVARVRYRSDVKAQVSFVSNINRRRVIEDRVLLPGVHDDSTSFDIADPKFWWCVGMGEPYLYDFSMDIKRGPSAIATCKTKFGIRTVQLVKEKDQRGESFYFKLNGRPVFCRGANYIPNHIFQDKVTPKDYVTLLNDVVASNMNMLRVWGGGIYEDDLFYELCDARGILVWQDFMYACAMYPGSGSFLKNAAFEAVEQIERLRNHPSIALWCGNNENNEAWHHWGWQMKFDEAQRTRVWRDYRTLFNDMLPTYVENYAGGVPYHESSPTFGRGNPKSTSEGDSHYWGVWHDEEPFRAFDKKVPRFMSEFGFQSFPAWKTIESFTLPDDRKLDSPVMLAHQKHPRGNALIAEYMKRDYHLPQKFEDFVYVSQLVQAEGMRTGIEAHRRNKPYCMGTLYWQLNDVWPVASWSGRDCFGRWKALQYYVREAFSPVAALPIVEDDILKVFAVSDLNKDTVVTVDVRALDFGGSVLTKETLPNVKVGFESRMVWQGAVKTILKKNKPANSVVEITLKNAEGQVLHRRLFYFVAPRDMGLAKTKIKTTVAQVNDGYQITLESKHLAKNVLLETDAEGFFEDNFFDLLPDERRTVLFRTQGIIENPAAAFRVRSLVDVE